MMRTSSHRLERHHLVRLQCVHFLSFSLCLALLFRPRHSSLTFAEPLSATPANVLSSSLARLLRLRGTTVP